MKIAIVDDHREEAEQMARYIEESVETSGKISLFSDGESFLKAFIPGCFDLIILDIFMGDMQGVDVAREIRKTDSGACLVFYTTSNEFASESYEVDAGYYLQKPISREKVTAMIKKLNLELLEHNRYIMMPDATRIYLRDILYTASHGHNITVYKKDGTQITVRTTHASAEEDLCCYNDFVCCSKGMVVNFNEVTGMEENCFVMSNGYRIPISRRKAKECEALYTDFCFQRLRKRGMTS